MNAEPNDLEPIDYDENEAEVIEGTPDKRKNVPGYSGVGFAPERRRPRRWPLYVALGCLLFPCICCALPVGVLAAGGVTLAAVFDNSEATLSDVETIPVEGDLIPLEVNNNVGDITIQPGTDDEVRVEYTKRAYALSKGRAEEELNSIVVDVSQRDDGTVVVSTDQGDDDDNFFFRSNRVDLVISVPENVELRVTNDVGEIEVANGLNVEELSLRTDVGDVRFSSALVGSGPYSLIVNVGEIRLTLPANSYLQLDAQTNVGDVSVSGFTTSDEAQTNEVGASLNTTLGEGDGSAPTLTAQVDVGSIRINSR